MPIGKARLIVARHLVQFEEQAWHTWFPEIKKRWQAKMVVNIICHLAIAEANGHPMTTTGLASHMGIDPRTAQRHVDWLLHKNFLLRKGRRRLLVNGDRFRTQQGEPALKRLRKLYVDATTALVREIAA